MQVPIEGGIGPCRRFPPKYLRSSDAAVRISGVYLHQRNDDHTYIEVEVVVETVEAAPLANYRQVS